MKISAEYYAKMPKFLPTTPKYSSSNIKRIYVLLLMLLLVQMLLFRFSDFTGCFLSTHFKIQVKKNRFSRFSIDLKEVYKVDAKNKGKSTRKSENQKEHVNSMYLIFKVELDTQKSGKNPRHKIWPGISISFFQK